MGRVAAPHARNYRIPTDLVGRATAVGPVPRTLRPIFRDRDDFSAGPSLTEQTRAALEASRFLIVVCSPNALSSTYVNEEIRQFKALGRAAQVIGIIVDGAPGDAQRECLPPALRFRIGADGAVTDSREEPIAADARAEGDGKTLALQKTVAALIGVPLDELRRRDEMAWRRRATIRTLAGVSALVLVLAAGSIAVLHQWQQQHQTQRDRELREHLAQQREQATAQSRQIEELTAQLKNAPGTPAAAPGAEIGLKNAVTATVLGAAAGDPRYLQALELLRAGKPKDAEPLLRAVAEEKERAAATTRKEAAAAYRNLGAIAGLGDPKRALEAYQKAVELDGDDIDSRFWVGWMQSVRGDLDEARKQLAAVIRASGNDQTDWRHYWARMTIGDMSVTRGDLSGALTVYREARETIERLARADPGNADRQRDLSASYNRVGRVRLAQGKLDAALAAFRDGLEIGERLVKADPGNAQWQRDLSASHSYVGDVLLAQGDLAAALAAFRDGLEIRDRLVKTDPGNVGWQHDLSSSHQSVARVLLAQGKPDAALTAARASLEIAERLAKADPNNGRRLSHLAQSYERVGDAASAQGNREAALAAYRLSLTIMEFLARADPGNVGWQVDLLWVHWRLARRGDDWHGAGG